MILLMFIGLEVHIIATYYLEYQGKCHYNSTEVSDESSVKIAKSKYT